MAKRKHPVIKRANREERSQKRKQAVVTYFIVILMVSSVAGFALMGNQSTAGDTTTYNDYKFNQVVVQHPLASGYNINSFTESESGALFYSSPFQAEQIPVEGNLTDILVNKPYYIYLFEPGTDFDPIHDWLRFDLSSRTNKIVVPSVTSPSEVYPAFAIASCDNSTIDMPVIHVMEGDTTTITIAENGCIEIHTRPQDVLMVRDRIFYSLSGIMNK